MLVRFLEWTQYNPKLRVYWTSIFFLLDSLDIVLAAKKPSITSL